MYHHNGDLTNLLKSVRVFRCSLPKAMSISRSKIFRKKKKKGTEDEKIIGDLRFTLPKAISISRSEIFREKKKKGTKDEKIIGDLRFILP